MAVSRQLLQACRVVAECEGHESQKQGTAACAATVLRNATPFQKKRRAERYDSNFTVAHGTSLPETVG